MNFYVVAGNGFALRALASDSDRLHGLCFGDTPEESGGDEPMFRVTDLHKSWHLLRETLGHAATAAGDPGEFIFEGGRGVGEDAGYGCPRLLHPDEVSRVWALLEPVGEERVDQLLDLEADPTLGVLYGIGPDEPREELVEELQGYLKALRVNVQRAAEAGESLLLVMS